MSEHYFLRPDQVIQQATSDPIDDTYAYVIDLEGNRFPLQATLTKQSEINNNETLSFRVLPTDVNMAFIQDITEYWSVVDHDGLEHKVVYFRKKGEGKLLTVDIRAIPVYIDELKRKRVYERYDKSFTAHDYFSLIFDDTPYDFVLVGSFLSSRWEGLGEGDDKATMFSNGLNRYGAEFELVGNTFYIRNRVGRDVNFMYRHRLNASNIVLENDATEFYTYARGYGNYGDGDGGEDWRDAKLIREYTSPLAQIFGIREAPPVKNGNITDHATMMDRLMKLVNESLKISVTASIHDMRKQGYPLAQPRIGDMVTVIDERINFKEDLRIVSIQETKNWRGKITDIQVTFGTPGLAKRHQSNINAAVKNVNDVLEGRKTLPSNLLDNAVAEATKALTRMRSELDISETGSLVAVDKTDPNNIVILNAAGLGVSDDGGATFKSAITGKGINAEVITAGILRGITIIQKSGNRGLELSNGEIFSYYNNRLAMKFGQYSHEFYHTDGSLIGTFGIGYIPMQGGGQNNRGLNLYVNNSFFDIVHEKLGVRNFAFRTATFNANNNYTAVAGPRAILNRSFLGLYTDAQLWKGNRRTDQASILLEQTEDSHDIHMFFGGRKELGGRKSGKLSMIYNDSDNTSQMIAQAQEDQFWARRMQVGDSALIMGHGTAARIGPSDDTYIAIRDDGIVLFVHNGRTFKVFNPS
mgnify:CR=1 FL=1